MIKKGKPVKEKNQGPVNYISLSTSWEVWLIKLNTTLSIYFQKLEETTAKFLLLSCLIKWDKVFKRGPNKISGRQPLKNLN